MYTLNQNKNQIYQTPRIWSLAKWMCLVLLIGLSIYPVNSLAQEAKQAQEYEAKAALLYNFAKFTMWPKQAFETSKSPFIIAILGKNPFGDAFDILREKKIGGRSIEIRYFSKPSNFEPCQILYCTLEDLKHFSKTYPGLLDQHHVLTVGQEEDFVRKGGILSLAIVEEHLAFKVNTKATRSAGIEISANLLKLAIEVVKE